MSKFISGTSRDRLMAAFADAVGVSHNHIRRVIVDLQVGSPGIVYFETFADTEVIDVVLRAEIEIVDTAEEAA
jgi:hypothetical protein